MTTPVKPVAVLPQIQSAAKKTWSEVVVWAAVSKAAPNWLFVAVAFAGFLLGRLI